MIDAKKDDFKQDSVIYIYKIDECSLDKVWVNREDQYVITYYYINILSGFNY